MQIVIIGSGIAGDSAATAIRQVDTHSKTTLITEETVPLYSPCVLDHYLSGEIQKERVFLKKKRDYLEEKISVIYGQRVFNIDVNRKRIILEEDDRKALPYDRLIMATGSEPSILPVEGVNKRGVFNFKKVSDVSSILRHRKAKKAVIWGAGLIGIKLCSALKRKGLQVHLIKGRSGRILPTMFEEKFSFALERILEKHGITVWSNKKVKKILGDEKVEGVDLNGEEILCDLVISATGMKPKIDLAKKAGVNIGELGGIKVDSHMKTNIDDIFACGDCIEVYHPMEDQSLLSGLWADAKREGYVAGFNSIGAKKVYNRLFNLRVIHVFDAFGVSIGCLPQPQNGDEVLEGASGTFQYKIAFKSGKIAGLQAIGEFKDAWFIFGALQQREDVTKIRSIIENQGRLKFHPWYFRLAPYLMARQMAQSF